MYAQKSWGGLRSIAFYYVRLYQRPIWEIAIWNNNIFNNRFFGSGIKLFCDILLVMLSYTGWKQNPLIFFFLVANFLTMHLDRLKGADGDLWTLAFLVRHSCYFFSQVKYV